MSVLKKARMQLLNEHTGAVIEEVDVLTSAEAVNFSDGETFQQKLDRGKLKGDRGEAGAQGQPGQKGEDGSVWHNGTTAPSSQGKDGDYYLNTENGDVYKKEHGSWSKQGNIKGAPGSSGSGGGGDNIKVGTSLETAQGRKLFFKVVS